MPEVIEAIPGAQKEGTFVSFPDSPFELFHQRRCGAKVALLDGDQRLQRQQRPLVHLGLAHAAGELLPQFREPFQFGGGLDQVKNGRDKQSAGRDAT